MRSGAVTLIAVLLFGACGSDDGDNPPGGGGDDGLSDDPTLCEANSDCEHAEYFQPVESEDECYCPPCPSDLQTLAPINHEAQTRYREQWELHCTSWAERRPCPPLPCPLFDPPICDDGVCAYAPEP